MEINRTYRIGDTEGLEVYALDYFYISLSMESEDMTTLALNMKNWPHYSWDW